LFETAKNQIAVSEYVFETTKTEIAVLGIFLRFHKPKLQFKFFFFLETTKTQFAVIAFTAILPTINLLSNCELFSNTHPQFLKHQCLFSLAATLILKGGNYLLFCSTL